MNLKIKYVKKTNKMKDYSELTLKELKALPEFKKIKGRSKLTTRKQICAALGEKNCGKRASVKRKEKNPTYKEDLSPRGGQRENFIKYGYDPIIANFGWHIDREGHLTRRGEFGGLVHTKNFKFKGLQIEDLYPTDKHMLNRNILTEQAKPKKGEEIFLGYFEVQEGFIDDKTVYFTTSEETVSIYLTEKGFYIVYLLIKGLKDDTIYNEYLGKSIYMEKKRGITTVLNIIMQHKI